MAKSLLIVESPTKARTIKAFLGPEYQVESSVGHIRDLPGSQKDIPKGYRDQQWAKDWGINVEDDFQPLYVVSAKARKIISDLKGKLRGASQLFLATDEDREGEAIAWHLKEVLNPQVPVRRMVFHEITREAIAAALENPRDINQDLVDAQEARRALDRLVGWGLSPVLWAKVKSGLSAGRVQSVAVRMVVQRERERMAHRSAEWWDLEGVFVTRSDESFTARLSAIDGTAPANGKDFNQQGELTNQRAVLLDQARAVALAGEAQGGSFPVRSVESKPYTNNPYPPFRTSTLQQEASRKRRFNASRTMRAAQGLYENGYITYMRTDSTSLAQSAVDQARRIIQERFGSEYLSAKPRRYTGKVKNAQEAHEAIRPAGDSWRDPRQVASQVNDKDQQALYELIWNRTLASQMAPARGSLTKVVLGGETAAGTELEFTASGKTISFPGFLRVYVAGSDDPEAELEDRERLLPDLEEDDPTTAREVNAKHHQTKPPGRFTEASLVKEMEEQGIGRPSTYASIMSRIIEREYVWKKGPALVPSVTAFTTVALLENYFEELVDFGFTARMEDDLDRIARGEQERAPWLRRFFYGNGAPGLQKMISSDNIGRIDYEKLDLHIGDDEMGRSVHARSGRYGPYLVRGESRASIPPDLPPDELTLERAAALLEAASEPPDQKILGTDPDSGLVVLALTGRYGPYVQLGEGGAKSKLKRASLFKDMEMDALSLDDALRLLSIPREVGRHPGTGEAIMASNGRYGPYLKMGSETRDLDSERQILEITLEEATAKFNQPKPDRRGRGSAPPLKELGNDPESGGAVTVRDGRYGMYVSDGVVNASLRKNDTVEGLTLERAAELLAARRQKLKDDGKWPPKPRSPRKR